MENIMVTDIHGHYEVRLFGYYVCTVSSYEKAMAAARAYLNGGEQG